MVSPAAWKVVLLLSGFELFVVGGLGAWLAARLRITYLALLPVTLVVYLAAGYFTAQTGDPGGAAGAVVAFLEFSAWALFGGFGPQPTSVEITSVEKIATVATATLVGAVCGTLGSLFASSAVGT
jgi:hypothetical protein